MNPGLSIFLVRAFALLLPAGAWASAVPEAREGDLIFHQSRSSQSLAVQQVTRSPYSHMGVVLLHRGRPHVYEASATVRYTPLAQWIARGEGGRYVLKRLRHADRLLDASALQRLHRSAATFEGRAYDLTFEWSDTRLYCSELVWKLYRQALGLELGQRQRIRDFDLSAPAVQVKLRERYGDKVPLDEPVISPVAMFESALLVEVASH
ncbi:MAG: YiiX family permuted papain-like enzyme [Pseudomonadota bacterium]